MTANSEPGQPALAEGTKIGGCYVLRRKLGKSDASPVWLATDEVLGKDVTLHFVPASVIADSRAMAELRQEVKRNRQLIHPNILRVYDFVEDGNLAAISMDDFEGESLAEILKRKGRLDTADVKPWIAQLAETLADAHRIQLFHRDLSPTNLYLRPNGGLLVANFGVSRVILNSLERGGVAKGGDAHLEYLSPQQIDGERPTAGDDIYGFGVLMHTLLGGASPFSGTEMLPQIRKTVPAAISDVRAAAGATAPVPAAWEKLITACLEKTSEARPRNLTDVLTLLGQDSGPAVPRGAAAAAAAVEKVAASKPEQRAASADVPAKTAGDEEAKGGNLASEKIATPEPEHATSGRPLHPEIPPLPPRAADRKAPAKGALSANFPDLERPRSKAPLVWLTVAASIIGVGIYMRNKSDQGEDEGKSPVENLDPNRNPSNTPVPTKEARGSGMAPSIVDVPEQMVDPTPVKPPQPTPGGTTVATTTPSVPPKPPIAIGTPLPKSGGGIIGRDPTPVPETPGTVAGGTAIKPTPNPKEVAAVKPTPEAPIKPPAIPTPAPAAVAKDEPLPKLPNPIEPLPKISVEKLTKAQLAEAKAQREAALQGIRATADEADAAHDETTRRLETAKVEKDKLQKGLDTLRKVHGPVILQSDQIEADRKKFEAEAEKSAIAAAEATKQAEAAKRKLDDLVAKGGDKLKERLKAEAELNAASTMLVGVSKKVADLSQIGAKADTIRMQARLSQQQAEQDLQKIEIAREKIRVAEGEAMRKVNQGKITLIEKEQQAVKSQITRHDAMIEQLRELGPAGKEAIAKLEEKKAAAQQQLGEMQSEINRLSGKTEVPVVKDPVIKKDPVTVKPVTATPVPEAPIKLPASTPAPEAAAPVNSLGMKFVPVGETQFSVYLTTVKNFEAFASATGLKSETWKNSGFKQTPDHPVVNVTWREADAFCKWLTDKERKAGLLKSGEAYRLPTDLEWSKAVGLPAEHGGTPEDRDMGVQDVYPWGTAWPPPAGAGNYAGEETPTDIPIPGYNDGFANTSPVGKFQVNAAGLYDMGGNVWQWVGDFWNGENRAKTLRGGSWYNGAIPLSLLSSCRISSSPDTLHDTYGFRIVKAGETAKSKKR